VKGDVHLIETLDDALSFKEWLGQRRDWLAFDLETEGLNVGRDKIRLAQFGDTDDGWAIPYEQWGGLVGEVIPDYSGKMVAHNLLFDAKFLKRDGYIVPQAQAHDTMIMAHLIDPMKSTALKQLGTRYIDKSAGLGQKMLTAAKAKQGWTWSSIPVDFPGYWAYGALDTIITAQLAEKLWPQVQDFKEVYEVELACIHVLRDAELTGMAIDLGYCEAKSNELAQKMEHLRSQLPIDNPRSDQQLRDFLVGRGAQLLKKTDKGNLSVDDDVLHHVATVQGIHEAETIREFRAADKLLTSYFSNFAALEVGGVLRPSVRPTGARTGRMSVTSPALQTLPRGRVVRDAFVAREGHRLISADFQQIELRVMAHYAQEQEMIAAFKRNEDLHTWTAAQVYNKDIGSVTSEERQLAKNCGFAKIYGAGTTKFAMTAGVSTDVAERFLHRYDELFPGVKRFQEKLIHSIRQRAMDSGGQTGFVITRLGRRLPVEARRAYTGVNYLVQSSSTADILKLKLVELSQAGLNEYIRLPVHDEIIFEVPEDEADEVSNVIKTVMPERDLFSVPLEIDCSPPVMSWGDAK